MAPVMTRCRDVGHVVPTGFWTCDAVLDRGDARYAFHCAACGKIHEWLPQEVWVESGRGE